MTIKIFAPAKLNLTLRVGPPGFEGRHTLDSLVCFTTHVGDELHIEPDRPLSLTGEGPFVSDLALDDTNLILQAAKILAHEADQRVRGALHVVKNLPLASGIGGGSGDAAAALIGLNEAWGLGYERARLAQLGAQLGADVPACVMGVPVHMTGTGETLTPLGDLAPCGIVLVNPGIACPTSPVYRHYDALGAGPELLSSSVPNLAHLDALLRYLDANPNDLEDAAQALVPEIGDTLELLAQSPDVRLVRMSGSGATCFGLYNSYEAAHIAHDFIVRGLANPRFWVKADRLNA
ncbi:4-(cytidine 5'-diphospho)-2-C-methyl-D-erythritol kinase [Candidatus Phycosocius spiralis]|uniref:4-diphosphocytidyl-2-C-methyl-D-erythritol kinase n=1 Tax=Candidatus Phycosocius spiralis TaxID=2815099 RepID=A0ABQ4PVE6_9PROT|nr:4-(cytidine 5'-diphospho)-2-C-methyl-D-erythritol kinase [Candidatus Phycosocius spiralis]GIU66957.1 4-diphosphocytidyl-2-C-methyl-D-erythritol kinase [Candidatus Phycosocius spiralis]